MPFDPTILRRLMGRFATGVTVVTTCYGEDDQLWGMTANSLTSLSLDPPLMLVTVDRRNSMCEYMQIGQCFAVSILNTHQEALSRQFATRGPKDFSGLNVIYAETGAPILADALAYMDCRVTQVVPGGDHDIFIGEVVAGSLHEGQPLLFYNGRYTRLALSGTGSLLSDTEEEPFEHYGSF